MKPIDIYTKYRQLRRQLDSEIWLIFPSSVCVFHVSKNPLHKCGRGWGWRGEQLQIELIGAD